MSMNHKMLLVVTVLAGAAGVRFLVPSATASPHIDPVTAAMRPTGELLRLMDTDENGKVSKAEFMHFMSSEFDRLDVNHDGELDPNELSATRYHIQGGSRGR